MNLNRFLSGLTRQVKGERATAPPPQRRDDQDDGIGVPVPAGPRPIRGGAQAKPPALEDEEFDAELTLRP